VRGAPGYTLEEMTKKIIHIHNLKFHKKVIWIFFLVALLIPWQWVYACSLAIGVEFYCSLDENIFTKEKPICISEDCVYQVLPDLVVQNSYDLQYENHQIGIVNQEGVFINAEATVDDSILGIISKLCEDINLDQIPLLSQIYEDWRKDQQSFSSFIIEKYNEDQKIEFNKTNENLLSCQQSNYQHIGNWLASYSTIKQYCYRGNPLIPLSSCSWMTVHFNLPAFIGFVFRNPKEIGATYALSFLSFILLIFMGFTILIKRGELGKFLFPKRDALFGLIIFIPFTICSALFLDSKQILILVVGFYLLFCTGSYIILRLTPDVA
jgi:hypothetical protein